MFELIPDEDPRLHQVCEEVDTDSISDLTDTISAMFPFMYENNGCGLAAPQIGITKRFFIIGYGGREFVCINPEILTEGGHTATAIEGCLSYPGQQVQVTREEAIKVRYLTKDGKTKTHWMRDMMARIFQHELDHLNGIVMRDRDNASF